MIAGNEFFCGFCLAEGGRGSFYRAMRSRLRLLLPVALGGILLFSMPATGSDVSALEAEELLRREEAVLIDVREEPEYRGGVAEPALLLPLSDLRGDRTKWEKFLPDYREKILILYCASGNRSGQAAKILQKEGFTTRNLGGFARWKNAGLPVKTP